MAEFCAPCEEGACNAQPRAILTDPAGLFAALAELQLPLGDYVVCGSAVLYVRGIRARITDLDVVLRGVAWQRVLKLGEPEPALSGYGLVIRHPTHPIELLDRWTRGWSTDRLIADADLIDGVPFMRLGDIAAWKSAAARPKDLADVAAIGGLIQRWQGTRARRTPWTCRTSAALSSAG